MSLIGSSARDVKDVTSIYEKIGAKEVRLIDEDGSMPGHCTDIPMPSKWPVRKKLDLVEVSPEAVPPVARIMDYGKFKY